MGTDDPTPFGSAADLQTQPVSLVAADLLEQLDSFVAFVEALPEETAESGTFVIPPLENLAGGFTGEIEVAANSLALSDLSADFDLRGNSWTWGTYSPPNEFDIQGEIEQMTVAIETAVINAGETAINLSGAGNLDELDGQLRVDNLPVEIISALYPSPMALPLELAGALDIRTTFDGSLANPVVRGEATVVDTQVNGHAFEQARADFLYRNAELTLDSEVAVASTDTPITVEGSLLYALPFMSVQPPADTVALTALIPGDSFDLINALTDDQVRWEGGAGQIEVQVGGTVQQPAVAGLASFREGIISSSRLNNRVTNLNGDVQFDLTQVNIQQLQANLDSGQINIAGQLPLLTSGQSVLAKNLIAQAATTDEGSGGLSVVMSELPVNYDGLFQAVFDGRVLVTGAVLEPTVSGSVDIDDGQIQANQLLSEAGSLTLPSEETLEDVSPYRLEYLGAEALDLPEETAPNGLLDRITVQGFDITLGDRLAIVGQPFYNLSALGNLTVNGTLRDLQPTGTIALKSGWINLFSTQFRLDPNAPNTATFTPETGLNPFVDVVMSARVQNTEVTPAPPQSGGFVSAETDINPGIETIGEVRYVEVQAIAQGPVSELGDNLTLTSNDSRSEGELLALLGSDVFSGLATGSYVQLAEYFGAGSLASLGNSIADAVGLQSFSVFPTTDTSPDSSVGDWFRHTGNG